MAETSEETGTGTGRSARRTRPQRERQKATSRSPKRRASPPNRVEPGFIHRKIATVFLRELQNRATAKGLAISVGELPEDAPITTENGSAITEDGREPVELLARILAHIGHRVPGLRKVEKRLEGTDAKSGFASDVLALFGQLLSRNEQVAVTAAEAALKQAVANNSKADSPENNETVPPAYWPGQETTPTEVQ